MQQQKKTNIHDFKNKLLSFLAVAILYITTFYIGVSNSIIFQINSPAQKTGQFLIWPVISKILIFAASNLLILTTITILSYCVSRALLPDTRKKLTPIASAFVAWMIIQSITLYCTKEYPHLDLSIISGSYDNALGRYAVLWITLTTLITATITAIIKTLRKTNQLIAIIAATAILTLPLLPANSDKTYTPNPNDSDQPNVILIGFDSLSDRQVDQYSIYMPTLSKELAASARFHNTYTAIGRTFPSWNSILSGSYPVTTNMRENLDNFQTEEFRNHTVKRMLSHQLKNAGYTTLYAQDERRFNNINEDYGFDRIIGPPVGVTDLIIPSLQNNIFSAYFISSPAGAWLFPDLYQNRVAELSYNPDRFIRSILNETSNKTNKPLFLAVHLCMAHFPYTWNKSPISVESELKMHQLSANQADRQLHLLLKGLDEQGITKNAIIVYLSDHGEGIETPETWLKQETTISQKFNRITRGHGNSLMTPDQVNSFLAFKIPNKKHSNSFDTTTSLIDIKPTILDILKIKSNSPDDGTSLLPIIEEQAPSSINRIIYMESSSLAPLPLPGTRKSVIADTYKDQSQNYTVKPNGLLTLTDSAKQEQIKKKQFGAIKDDFILIADCQQDENSKLLFINTKQQTITTPPETLANEMISGLKNYMGELWCIPHDWNSSTVAQSSM